MFWNIPSCQEEKTKYGPITLEPCKHGAGDGIDGMQQLSFLPYIADKM